MEKPEDLLAVLAKLASWQGMPGRNRIEISLVNKDSGKTLDSTAAFMDAVGYQSEEAVEILTAWVAIGKLLKRQ